jgi:hypothetical protein
MRTLQWTILRMNPALFAAYMIAFLSCVASISAGDLHSAAIFAILGFLALGIETKFRNPAAVAMRLTRPRRRGLSRQADPSHN